MAVEGKNKYSILFYSISLFPYNTFLHFIPVWTLLYLGASEPKHMAYMVRLGIWGPGSPFRDFNDFLAAVEKRGVGAMEIVAMDMKLRGMYIARQLSFQVTLSPPPQVPLFLLPHQKVLARSLFFLLLFCVLWIRCQAFCRIRYGTGFFNEPSILIK